MASPRDVRRYRQRLFRFSDVETIGALILIALVVWFCTSALPITVPDGIRSLQVKYHGVTARLVGQQ
jgi:archaellum biogenesis protein FlaJ (TadC family)